MENGFPLGGLQLDFDSLGKGGTFQDFQLLSEVALPVVTRVASLEFFANLRLG